MSKRYIYQTIVNPFSETPTNLSVPSNMTRICQNHYENYAMSFFFFLTVINSSFRELICCKLLSTLWENVHDISTVFSGAFSSIRLILKKRGDKKANKKSSASIRSPVPNTISRQAYSIYYRAQPTFKWGSLLFFSNSNWCCRQEP